MVFVPDLHRQVPEEGKTKALQAPKTEIGVVDQRPSVLDCVFATWNDHGEAVVRWSHTRVLHSPTGNPVLEQLLPGDVIYKRRLSAGVIAKEKDDGHCRNLLGRSNANPCGSKPNLSRGPFTLLLIGSNV